MTCQPRVLPTCSARASETCSSPCVRNNCRGGLRRAPSHRKSIFEYAAQSHGAADYNRVVDWVLASNEAQQQTSTRTTDATVAA